MQDQLPNSPMPTPQPVGLPGQQPVINPTTPPTKNSSISRNILLLILLILIGIVFAGGTYYFWKNKPAGQSSKIITEDVVTSDPLILQRYPNLINDQLGISEIDIKITDDSSKEKANIKIHVLSKIEAATLVIENLEDYEGYLFKYSNPSYYHFSTQSSKIPLDFIWINDETIVEIRENLPAGFQQPPYKDYIVYIPKEEIDQAIIVKAGFTKTHNIRVGDIVNLINP